MIEKVMTKTDLQEPQHGRADLSYWLKKTPEERVSAVEDLRRQYYGSALRLQRVARVIQRTAR